MKTFRLLFFGALIFQSVWLSSIRAQIYSPRRLTQRIAPQPAPAQPNPPRSVAQPVVRPLQSSADPERLEAERAEALRKGVEFRKQRAEEDPQSAEPELEANSPKGANPPLVIECGKVEFNPRESLQYVSLSLSNTFPKAISRVTMRLIYYGGSGEKLKEWTTRRELDYALESRKKVELIQPAYFMPLVTRRVKVEVKEVCFSDGSLCRQ